MVNVKSFFVFYLIGLIFMVGISLKIASRNKQQNNKIKLSIFFRVVFHGPNLLDMSTFIPTGEFTNLDALKSAYWKDAVNSNF